MKTLKISADNEISIIDVNFDDFKSIQKALGGHFETVHTVKMNNYFQGPVIMLVDEEGHFKNLPLNRFGSWMKFHSVMIPSGQSLREMPRQ